MSGKSAQVSPLHLIFRDLTLRGFWLFHPQWQDHPAIQGAVKTAAQLIGENRLQTPIAATYPLEEAADAFAHAQRGAKSSSGFTRGSELTRGRPRARSASADTARRLTAVG
jgi:NADPH:quinone reductase-like Zn-dependent oxidoreductase